MNQNNKTGHFTCYKNRTFSFATDTAILFLPFVDILSLPIVLNLGLVLAVLIIREGYIHKTDRTECEAITSFMTPALIIFFNAALGWASPSLMVAGDGIIQRAAKLAVPIALCRYLLGKDPGPRHPHKDLLRLANRTWFFKGVWMAGAETAIDQARVRWISSR